MSKGIDTGSHPKRKVGRDSYTEASNQRAEAQGWPATTDEWANRGQPGSPVRADDVSLGQYGDWHHIKHRPGDSNPQ